MALLGAAGGIGQPLGLLLKMNKYISELSLYDIAPFTPGVAKDLSHCNTPSKVSWPHDVCQQGVACCTHRSCQGCRGGIITTNMPQRGDTS